MHAYLVFISVYLSLFHIIINSRKHHANYNVSYCILCLSYAGLILLQRFYTKSQYFSQFLLNLSVPLISGLLGLSLAGMARSLFNLSRFSRIFNTLAAVILILWALMAPLYILSQNLIYLQIYYTVLVLSAAAATVFLYLEVYRLRQYRPFQRPVFILFYTLLVAHGLVSIIFSRLTYAAAPRYIDLPGVFIISLLFIYTIADLVTPDSGTQP